MRLGWFKVVLVASKAGEPGVLALLTVSKIGAFAVCVIITLSEPAPINVTCGGIFKLADRVYSPASIDKTTLLVALPFVELLI